MIQQAHGPVTQVFGEQRNVRVGTGDYAEGPMDKREGAFIDGGNISGVIIGVQKGGTVAIQQGTPIAPPAPATPSLAEVVAQLQHLAAQIRQRGDADLADDLLTEVGGALQAALTAEQAGKSDRRQQKLHAARERLHQLADTQPDLAQSVHWIEHVP